MILVGGLLAGPAVAKPNRTTDKAAATAALLQLSELPAGNSARGFRGWETRPAGSTDVMRLVFPDPAFPACAATIKVENASAKFRVDTGDYGSNADTIRNSIYVLSKVKQAKAYLAAYAKPAEQQCYQHSVITNDEKRLAGAPGPIQAQEFPAFDASTVPPGSLNEGVGLNAWWTDTNPRSDYNGNALQDLRYRSGRAVISLSSWYGSAMPKTGVPSYFPGTANYLVAIADRLEAGLKK